jgi:hypothetical protein
LEKIKISCPCQESKRDSSVVTPLAIATTLEKLLVLKALLFLKGASGFVVHEDRGSPVLTYTKNRKGKQYDKENGV